MKTSHGFGVLVACLLAFVAAGCGMKIGRGQKKIVVSDFAEGRVVDVSITERLTGTREMLFFSKPKKTRFLEGYIQGVITDYRDNPVQGIVVRAVAVGESRRRDADTKRKGLASTSFDPGVSDSNGFYRIRFSLPILNKKVDVRGRLLYSPGWEQDREMLGKAYEPQTKQSSFRMYYDLKRRMIVFNEGIRKMIVAPVTGVGGGSAAPVPSPTAASGVQGGGTAQAGAGATAGGEEDLFKGFGFGE